MPTKVFISWSGDLSGKIAEVISEWLPMVLQHSAPFMSALDIDKGRRWDDALANELEATSVGIVCLTPENLRAPWIMFEAGALSKKVGISHVCPLLFGGIQKADVQGPLASFQLTDFDEKEVKKLVVAINKLAPEEIRLKQQYLDKIFNQNWQALQEAVQKIISAVKKQGDSVKATPRSDREILEEILDCVRRLKPPGSSDPIHNALLTNVGVSSSPSPRDLLAEWMFDAAMKKQQSKPVASIPDAPSNLPKKRLRFRRVRKHAPP